MGYKRDEKGKQVHDAEEITGTISRRKNSPFVLEAGPKTDLCTVRKVYAAPKVVLYRARGYGGMHPSKSNIPANEKQLQCLHTE